MARNKLICGEKEILEIESSNINMEDSLPLDELSVDTLTAVVRESGMVPLLCASEGTMITANGVPTIARLNSTDPSQYGYGETVFFYHDNTLLGKFYLESVKRLGRARWQLECVSAMGLLMTDDHWGGMYSGEKAADVAADIIAGIIPYTMDASLGSTNIYGWLPKSSRRNNLRDLLFAIGGRIRKDENGDIQIVPYTEQTPYQIPPGSFYLDGWSVTGGNSITRANITEHAYIALDTDETITLFDGEAAAEPIVTPQGKRAEGIIVEFREPVHSLSAKNGAILEYGVNYAVLGQSASVTLTGKQYTHTERVISRNQTGAVQNVANASDCHLVNLLNAENVADRVMAFYGSAKRVQANIAITRQKPGDLVAFEDAFGEETTGYIESLDITVSNTLKAQASIVSGFIPTASGNYYTRVKIYRASFSWTVPSTAREKVRVVLIGGGDGGHGGGGGERGESATSSGYGAGGAGGAAGTHGAGGKIFVITIPVSPGQVLSGTVGAGGAGGAGGAEGFEGSPGAPGGATTLGPYSSEMGFSSASGFADLFSGTAYALPGADGVAGGSGSGSNGDGPDVTGPDGTVYHAGKTGRSDSYEGARAYGGAGGGAAAGSNGQDGLDGSITFRSDGTYVANGGDGGKGASPIAPDAAAGIGNGGSGGHGGGGGGSAGPASGASQLWMYTPGHGGEGSDGANGAAGGVLIYW